MWKFQAFLQNPVISGVHICCRSVRKTAMGSWDEFHMGVYRIDWCSPQAQSGPHRTNILQYIRSYFRVFFPEATKICKNSLAKKQTKMNANNSIFFLAFYRNDLAYGLHQLFWRPLGSEWAQVKKLWPRSLLQQCSTASKSQQTGHSKSVLTPPTIVRCVGNGSPMRDAEMQLFGRTITIRIITYWIRQEFEHGTR